MNTTALSKLIPRDILLPGVLGDAELTHVTDAAVVKTVDSLVDSLDHLTELSALHLLTHSLGVCVTKLLITVLLVTTNLDWDLDNEAI